jgi:FkbM family methyltransferase
MMVMAEKLEKENNPFYFSQFGQDRFIDEILQKREHGVFVDIGAYDGITLSNTYFFETIRKWTGICIEPIPSIYDELAKNRNCHCVLGCVGDEFKVANFLHVHKNAEYRIIEKEDGPKVIGKEHTEMLSGLVDFYHPRHLDLIRNEISTLKTHADLFPVKCFAINDILSENDIAHVDYLSIDTEGSELAILQSLDFAKFDIDIISAEILYPDIPMRAFMEQKNYVLIGKHGYDEIYRNKKFIS